MLTVFLEYTGSVDVIVDKWHKKVYSIINTNVILGGFRCPTVIGIM